MTGDWGFLTVLLVVSIPLGLTLAAFWAHGRFRRKRPKVPPGDPGNPA